jgi:LysM repeat protein
MKKRFTLKFGFSRQAVLLVCTILLILSSLIVSHDQNKALAANPGPGNVCSWYTVRWGDTLSNIGARYHISYWTLARVNAIANVNLIFVNQQLCIPVKGSSGGGGGRSPAGITASGYVNWYDYSALDWSTRPQVKTLLHQAAAIYRLPANLLLAIAWQESGWYQHVIAWDGGIGVMQIMPYTAMSINAGTGIRRDPYHLSDNILMGAQYLRWLWNGFGGNLNKIISGYNEGGWNVIHRGIFNWRYVDNVLSLMWSFRNS